MYLIAENPFRGEGESLPIHLNLRGWDTSGPDSRWHPTWLWKQTTGDWALLLSSNSTETSRTNLFNFYIYNSSAFLLIPAWMNHHTHRWCWEIDQHHTIDWPHLCRLRGSIDLNANLFSLWYHHSKERWYLEAISLPLHKCVAIFSPSSFQSFYL